METCSASETDPNLVKLLLFFFEKINFFNFYGIFKFQIFLKFFQIFVKNDEKYEQTRNWFLEQNNHARTTKTSLRPKTDQKWQFYHGFWRKLISSNFLKILKFWKFLEIFENFEMVWIFLLYFGTKSYVKWAKVDIFSNFFRHFFYHVLSFKMSYRAPP